MEVIGKNLAVIFDERHNFEFEVGGITLIKPKQWEHSAGTEDQGRLVTENVNKIDVNPQIATVIATNPNSFFKVGDKIFTHYMAYELKEDTQLDDIEISIIDEEFAIFKIENNEIVLPNGYYLGEQIMETELKSDYGLILNVVEKKKALTVQITHLPKEKSQIELNDVIQSIDDFNYQFDFNGKKYTFLKEEEIVAKLN